MTVEMLDLLTRLPVSGVACVCHEPAVFGHQTGCLPGRGLIPTKVPSGVPLGQLAAAGGGVPSFTSAI